MSQSLTARQELVKGTRQVFESASFEVSDCAGAPAFDLLAKKRILLLTKILQNLDSFKKQHSMDLRLASCHLSAYPLIVGERSSHRDMQSGVVYDRYHIPAMTLETLQKILLEKKPPHKRAARGGIYLQISGTVMRKLREKHGMSRKQLANELSVSDRAIHAYETGTMFPSERHEGKMIRLLGREIIGSLDLFKENTKGDSLPESSTPQTLLQREASQYLEEKGHKISWFRYAPFSGISKVQGERETRLILGITDDLETDDNRQRIQVTASMTRLAQKPWFWIVEDDSTISEDSGLPILTLHDLESIPKEALLERLLRLFFDFQNREYSLNQS